MKLINLSFLPSFKESCQIHHHLGDLPCPWPGCPNGIADDCFLGVFPDIPADKKKKYIRKAWQSFDGSARYSWDDTTLFSFFGLNKLIREENLRCMGPDPQFPGIVYHYTSIEGLFKIISSNELWLTDYEYMNDSSEIIHGLDIAKEVLKEIEGLPMYSEQQDIVRAWRQFLDVKHKDRIHIACFSTDGDNLSQWKGYGGSGAGVSIGLDITDYSFWHENSEMRLGRVVYEQDKQTEILRNFFHLCLTMSDWDNGKQITDVYGKAIPIEKGRDCFKDYIGDKLAQFIVFFKNEAFKDEREIRWVHQENNRVHNSIEIPYVKRKFRIKGNQIIPYTTSTDLSNVDNMGALKMTKNDKLPIKQIVVGPQENASLVIAGIKEYLSSFGYSPDIVKLSLVPFRSGK